MQDQFQSWASQTPELRKTTLKMIHKAGSGHPGGSLSLIEILMSLLGDNGVMDIDPKDPLKAHRDRLVLSKGHGVPALYAIMSSIGYDITQDELMSLRQMGSRLQGHPDRARLPYMEASTGSLGQGLSISQGLAMAYKADSINHRIFCIVGDGEIQEGQIWEAAMSSAHYKLDNLSVIVDYNKGQIDGPVSEVMGLEPLKEKWTSFGWNTVEVDGHNYNELYDALKNKSKGAPQCVIAHTLKGKGVDFMEHPTNWHGRSPSDEELKLALEKIDLSHPIGV